MSLEILSWKYFFMEESSAPPTSLEFKHKINLRKSCQSRSPYKDIAELNGPMVLEKPQAVTAERRLHQYWPW